MPRGIWFDDEKLAVFESALSTMAEFRHVFGIELKPASVGELHAARVLELEICASATQQGYDALAPDGTRYQVKYRADKSHHVLINNFDFDYLVLVNLDEEYRISGMWRITSEQAQSISAERSGEGYHRYQTTQAKIKAIGQQIR